jgi:hypothetical protein
LLAGHPVFNEVNSAGFAEHSVTQFHFDIHGS